MAIDIKFDLVGNPEPPTIILVTRNGDKLGQLDVNADSIDLNDKFNDASEFSFTLNKYVDDKLTNLWDKVVNFKLVYCQEWDMCFEITVELDEETETVKTVFCTQLGQAELSQLMLYNIHINEEGDSNWNVNNNTYKSTILYDDENTDISLLHRLLKDKAPHYSIKYVDPTIRNIQRTFSFDNTSIYDAFMEIAEEIGCLFVFHSNFDEHGKIQRTISVYDLQQNCLDCGNRGEFTDKCSNPECQSKNIKFGYGEDTTIFITSDELASAGIQLTTDTDEVKNCFKLEAGDDLMTATVRNCNPNGTDYIFRFSDEMKSDMSDELVEKLESYDNLYKKYSNEYISNVDIELLNNYNALIDKYSVYNENLQKMEESIIGYSSLMNAYYNAIDLSLYLKSGLMPNVKMGETNAEEQGLLLETSLPSLIAVANMKTVSLTTANSNVLAMAKAIVSSAYKVEISSSELIDNNWSGNFIVTNYSDEEDTYVTGVVSRTLTDWDEAFIKQKIEKVLSKENTDDVSITGLFNREYDDFCAELKQYALNPLTSFHDACQACIDILIEQGVGSNDTWSDTDEGSDSNLYENLYVPYYNKLKAIESEMKIREDEIGVVLGSYDIDGNFIKGLQSFVEDCRNDIQDALNFQNYLGKELWLEFCAYRREDKYSNDNYISDGLNNADLFKKALEFFRVAENEIYKASELQHQISTTLNNLLAIPKFKPLLKYFKVGNWIRVQVDDEIYKLRLLEYNIDFGNFNNIPVEFSNVTKIKNGITDVENTLSQASSMATSYSSVKKQASQGEKSNTVLTNWVENGLSTTNTKIVGGYDDSLLFDKSGFWCRQYDSITGEYSDEQIKIFDSTIAITNDKWNTTKTAIGKYYYIDPITGEQKMAYGVNGETIVGKLLVGEDLIISNDNGKLEFDDNGLVVTGTKNTVVINPNNSSAFSIKNNSDDNYILYINDEGNLVVTGDIVATSLKMEDGSVIEGINVGNISGLSDVAISGSYNDLENTPTKLSDFTNDVVFITKDVDNLANYYNKSNVDNLLGSKVDTNKLSIVATTGSYSDLINTPTKLSDFVNDESFITNDVDNLVNYYNKVENDNLLNSKVDINNLATVATTGSYNDLTDIDELKNWILEQIQIAISQ